MMMIIIIIIIIITHAMSPYTISKLYLLHICVLVSLFYVKIQLKHIPLYSHCYTPTFFSPKGAILRGY